MRHYARWLTVAFAAALCAVALAASPPKNFVRLADPSPVGEIAFSDADGHAHTLADFKGKVVLLNIWATWCVPCRAEMPALDRLQGSLGSSEFQVVTVSIDRSGADVVSKFYRDVGIHHLPMYLDPSGQLLRQVRAVGLPTSLLIDPDGRELGRVVGPAEWDQPQIADFLTAVVAAKGAPIRQADRARMQQPTNASEPSSPGIVKRSLHWLGGLLGK